MKNESPYWYCAKRKMFNLPHTWHKFEECDSRLPLGKSLVLVRTNELKGWVLRTPKDYARTKSLFKRLRVVWWSYLPLPPGRTCPQDGPQTCDDLLLHCDWSIDRKSIRAMVRSPKT